jgi:hypothetical protein
MGLVQHERISLRTVVVGNKAMRHGAAWLAARRLAVIGWLVLAAADAAWGQLPAARLDAVFPASLVPGSETEITIAGAHLDSVDRLYFSHPGITAEQKMASPGPFDAGPQPVPNQFVVKVAADVPPQQYDVRAQGLYGLSNPRVLTVDPQAVLLEIEPNAEPEQATAVALPAVICGQINGAADVDWFRLEVAAGERMVVDCEARRIDSRLDTVVRVSDANGQTVAERRDAHDGDPLLDFSPSAAGTYFISVRDALYRGGAEYTYRLRIGRLPHVDFVFPPAGLAGSNPSFVIYGRNLPGGTDAGLQIHGRPLEKITAAIALPADASDAVFSTRVEPHQAGLDAVEYRVRTDQGVSSAYRVYTATAPVIMEEPNNDDPQQPQKVAVPCEIAGQFFPARDADWFTFEAAQGQTLSIELYSNQLGLPTDPMLLVQQVIKSENGEQVNNLALVDDVGNRDGGHEFDQRSGDPRYTMVAPADGTYRVMVRDGYSALRSDPRLVYRLALRAPQHDFRLAAIPADSSQSLLLRKGGRESIRVVAYRQDGFDGDIQVSLSGLPAGVTCSGVTIGPSSNAATLVLSADENVAPAIAPLQIVGKATIGGKEIARPARVAAASVPPPFMQPGQQMISVPARLTRELVLSISDRESAAALLAFGEEKVWETSRGGILKIPCTVARRNGYNGAITGMVSDLPPNINAQQVNIGGGANTAELQLTLTANAPTGTYTANVNGFVQGLEYRRNPEAAAAAAERKAEFEKILAETSEKAKQATEKVAQTQKELDEAKARVQTATNEKAAADKASTDAQAALTAAKDATAKAKQAAAEKTDDAGLAQAAANAEKAATDAEEKARTAAEAAITAEKNLADAVEKLQAAEKAKAEADTANQQAAQLLQQATQAKQTADQRAQQLENEARPRQVNYWTYSTPLVIRIAAHPITLENVPAAATVKQGENAEVPLKLTRLYGFDGPVTFQPQLPGGVGGLQIPAVQIANGQAENKLVITAAANATVGTHNMTLRAQMNFNGQNLILDVPLALTVTEVAAMQQ